MTGARSHVASSGRNTSAVASVSQNEYPGPVKIGSFARMIVCAARASGLTACSASASTKNVVNGTSSVASSGTRVTGMPSITSFAASGSTHTLYSATPLGVLPATSIAPAIETTAGTRDARSGIRSERFGDVGERTERDQRRVAVERVEQQLRGAARIAHAIHLRQVQHRQVVHGRPPLVGERVAPLQRRLPPARDGRVVVAAQRQQPQRVLHAGIAVRLAGPRDRDGVDRDVVALQQVEQGHDVVEGQIRVEHDVANGGAGRGRRRRAFGPVRHAGAREQGEHDRHRCHPSHGSSVGSHEPLPIPGGTTHRGGARIRVTPPTTHRTHPRPPTTRPSRRNDRPGRPGSWRPAR